VILFFVLDEFKIEIDCSTTHSTKYISIASYHWALTAVSVGGSLAL